MVVLFVLSQCSHCLEGICFQLFGQSVYLSLEHINRGPTAWVMCRMSVGFGITFNFLTVIVFAECKILSECLKWIQKLGTCFRNSELI